MLLLIHVILALLGLILLFFPCYHLPISNTLIVSWGSVCSENCDMDTNLNCFWPAIFTQRVVSVPLHCMAWGIYFGFFFLLTTICLPGKKGLRTVPQRKLPDLGWSATTRKRLPILKAAAMRSNLNWSTLSRYFIYTSSHWFKYSSLNIQVCLESEP